jgi:hypothetical protein
MDLFHKLTTWLDHYRYTALALLIGACLLGVASCQFKAPDPVTGKPVAATEIERTRAKVLDELRLAQERARRDFDAKAAAIRTTAEAGLRQVADEFEVSTSVGVANQTEGQKVPGVREVRKRAGTPGPQATSILDAKRAVDSYRRLKGRRPLQMLLRSTTVGLEEALKRGRMLQVAIDYGTFNRLMRRTGDGDFTGGHSVSVIGLRFRKGKRWTLLYDSLDDARRSPSIPQGPRWVPLNVIISSAEAFAGGAGRCQAGLFSGGQER